MRSILLTQGQFAIVDDEDFERLNAHKWWSKWSDNTQSYYATRDVFIDGRKSTIRMHREVVSADPKVLVDHKNHDTLDNTKQNLRICSNQQNHGNMRKHRDSSSPYKGVSRKSANRWASYIMCNGKHRYLGSFKSPELAAVAYDAAAVDSFGEFAATNRSLGLFAL